LFDNFEMKQPRALMSDDEAVIQLVNHPYFVAHVTPLQLLNRATDPFLSAVKPHTFEVLRQLDSMNLRNHLLLITRYQVLPQDTELLNAIRHLKLTLLVTHSGIADRRIEPFTSEVARRSIETAYSNADSYRVVNYWRPIVPGLNDSAKHLRTAAELAEQSHATVFTGLFYRHEIRSYYQSLGLPEPYQETARRKILPEELEQRIINYFRDRGLTDRLFRKTSCGVAFAHGLPDYNGHYGVRDICNICPRGQVKRCAAALRQPDRDELAVAARELGASSEPVLSDGAVRVAGLGEEQRYFLQHRFGYQVHDVDKPHFSRRHGRAEVGWESGPHTVVREESVT
jgi:hypothetical protein